MPVQRASSSRFKDLLEAAPSPVPERLSILLPYPLAGAFDYRVPPDTALRPGDYVLVPLGGREVAGVVWGAGTGEVPESRLRDIVDRLEVPPMPDVLRRFVAWVADYTMTPLGAVLRMTMSVGSALQPPRPVLAWRLADDLPEVRLTPARLRVVEVLRGAPPLPTADLAREAGVGVSVIKGMAAAGLLSEVMLPAASRLGRPDPDGPTSALSAAQAEAARVVADNAEAGGFDVTLLDGVTGSGKTEVYFEAIAAALRAGRQALVLLPEIALTAQWLDRFERRFGARPAEWHSDLSITERRRSWRAVAQGEARVVVGARSALFLPYPELGLIVVDEEHDAAFKQEEQVIYHARDMAVVRAQLGGIPILLVSATPSLETVQNVVTGRYAAVHLPDRHGGATLPEITALDLRLDRPPRRSWLAPQLRAAIAETLAAGEQVMLFLNRRGYAPLTLCRACGHRLNCPNCTAWLVEHRLLGRLQCHHCGLQVPMPPECPNCHTPGLLAPCGPGVERLAEEVAAVFPQARTALMTSDTVPGPRAAAALIRQVQDGAIDLVIGTQIMAKGHHFPRLTFVGVVDADLGLQGGDLRAAERTYQLLHQVAGRAGRAELPGRVLLQTYDPQHPVMRALVSGDRDRFLEAEAEDRREAGLPPFGRLAALIVSGTDAEAVDGVARALGRSAPHGDGLAVFGPAPAPFAILRGRHRRRLLLKCRRDLLPQPFIRSWLAGVPIPNSVRVAVDIDPYSFL